MTVVGNQYDWGIEALVSELRDIRHQSLEQRQRRHQPPKLPVITSHLPTNNVPQIDDGALSALAQRGFGSPNQSELKSVLNRAPAFTSSLPTADSAGSSFYFLDGVTSLNSKAQLPGLAAPKAGFDVHAVRRDFPILKERVNGHQLAWLDNAATTQKPQVVIDRISEFYQHENSNIHRAAHELAARATDAYEGARNIVTRFINAPSANEVIFVRGATEAINLVAKSWGRQNITEGDEIIVSWLEHHANIVPWQQLCAETGAVLRVIPVDDDGQVILAEFQKLLNRKRPFNHVCHRSLKE